MAAKSEEAKANKRAYNKRWAEQNRERMKELQKDFADKNPGYYAEAQRKYREKNRAKINQRAVERRKENIERERKKEREYYHRRCEELGKETMKALRRDYKLRGRYGMTLAEFDELFTSQGNKCASCGTDHPGSKYDAWHVDHCHRSGRIRGILCHHCNVIVGMAQECPDNLNKIINYIHNTKD